MWAKIFSYLWLIFFILIGVLAIQSTPKQIEKDKRFIDEQIKPRVEFIDSFRKLNNRLPSQKEFKIWQYRFLNHDYRKRPLSDSLINEIESSLMDGDYIRNDSEMYDELKPYPKNIDWSKNYVLSVWRGEWNEYYTSWNNHYEGNNYNWTSSIIGAIEMLLVGLLPFLVTPLKRVIKKIRNRLTN